MTRIFRVVALFLGLALGQVSFASTGNQVTVRGVSQPHKIKAMVTYYLDYWQLDSLHILLQYTNQLPRTIKGYTQYNECKKLGVTQVIIRISSKLSSGEQALTIAHEMIHVKQFRRGELKKLDGSAYLWKNRLYGQIYKRTYARRAWEQEAFRLEKKLYLLYLNSLKFLATSDK